MFKKSPRTRPNGGRLKAGPASLRLWSVLAVFLGGGLTGLAAAAPELPPLTTVSGSPRLPGKFIWADLVTDDVPKARKFYAELFGWRFRDMGAYTIAMNDYRPLCGMFQKERPKDREASPRWFGYISVSSVDRAQSAVTKGGGRVLAAPKAMPKRGMQAVFADPEGAIFGVIKSSGGDPEDFLPDPGDWIWIQLLSHDAKKASDFYRSVGGYEVIQNTSGSRLNDYVLASEGYARATVRTIAASASVGARQAVRPTWLPFVRVKSITESLAKAKELGGKVLIEPRSENLEGKVAVIGDPTGAAVGVLEWREGLLKGGR
jgi:predicted enzyme related to lactoylglutathione lyase